MLYATCCIYAIERIPPARRARLDALLLNQTGPNTDQGNARRDNPNEIPTPDLLVHRDCEQDGSATRTQDSHE